MSKTDIVYVDELYNKIFSENTGIDTYVKINIENKLKNAINFKNYGPKIIDKDLIKYFAENKDIIFNDISKFNNFKNIITEYTSYIYYYIFFLIFVVFIILHYIYSEVHNQHYSYLLIILLVMYIIILAYNNYVSKLKIF